MKKSIINLIRDLDLPKGIANFLTPYTQFCIYNKENISKIYSAKKRILITGSGFDNQNEADKFSNMTKLIKEISAELIKHKNIIIITGCCSDFSIPSMIIRRLKELDPTYPILGVSRYEKLPLKEKYKLLSKFHDAVLYCGYNKINLPKNWEFAPQDLIQVMVADYVISIHGSIGTNHEVSIAYELQKPVGLITGFKGVTDVHPMIVDSIKKEGRKQIIAISSNNSKKIINWLLKQ